VEGKSSLVCSQKPATGSHCKQYSVELFKILKQQSYPHTRLEWARELSRTLTFRWSSETVESYYNSTWC